MFKRFTFILLIFSIWFSWAYMANAQVVPLPGWGVRAWDFQDDLANDPNAWSGWQSEAFMFAPDGSFFEHSDEGTVQIYSVTVDVVIDVFTAIPIDIIGGVNVFVDGTHLYGSGNDHFVATFNLSAGTHIIDLIVHNGGHNDGNCTSITVGKCLWGIDENITFVKAGREETTSTTVYDISDTNLPGWGARGSEYNPDLHNPEDWGDWKSEAFMFAPDGSFFEYSNEYTIQIYSVTVDVTSDVLGHAIPIDIGGNIDVLLDGNLVIGNNNAHFDAVFDLPSGTHVIDLIVSNDNPDSIAWAFVGVDKCLWGTDEDIVFIKAGREVMTSPTIFDLRSKPLPNWRAKGWWSPDWENFKSEAFMFAPNGSFFECTEEDQHQLYSVVVDVVADAFGHIIPIDIDGSVDLFLDGNHLYHEENIHFDAILDLTSGRHKIELSVHEWDDRASIGIGKCLWGTDPNISFVNTIIAIPIDYPTIQAGIDAANPGDTVMVAAGIYNENITLKSGVKLQGSGTDFTTIDGGSNGSVVKMSGISDVTISGFTITNGLGDGQDYYYADNGGGIAVYECSNIMIRDNIITQNRAEGGHADGGGIMICKCSGDIDILNNSITDNYAQHWGGGISIQGTFNVRIKDSDISDNNASLGGGISLWEGDPAEGASARIDQNWITNNQGDGIYIGDDCSALIGGELDSANNIIGNTEYAVYNDSTEDIDATYNYWGTTVELEIQNLIYDYYDDIITEDYSVDAINGVVNYKPWTNEAHSRLFPFAQALDLDGKEDYVNIGDSSSLVMEDALTVEAWIYPMGSGNGGGGGIIVNKEGEYEIARDFDGTIIFALANSDPGWDWIDTGYRASLNAWIHIAWTYSAADGILKVFVSSIQVFSIAGNGNIGDARPSENDFRIGGRQCCGQFFDGLIDEVRIFNYARTQEEIQETMNTTLNGDELGLVGYWNFDGGGANDSSPHGNHGALEDDAEIIPIVGNWPPPKIIPDIEGPHTLALDGEGDYVNISSTPGAEDKRTVEAWFKVRDKNISTQKQVIYEEGGSTRGLNIYVFDSSLYVGGWNKPPEESGWSGTYLSTNAIESDKWYHVVLVLDGTETVQPNALKAYLNGNQFGSGDGSQLWEHNPCVIGAVLDDTQFHDGGEGGGHYFEGLIDEVRIWDIARTQEEIRATMNTTLVGDESDLVAYFPFDDGTARDYTENGYHGILCGDAGIIPIVDSWPPPLRGDVSGDNTVSAYDAALILRYVVGLMDEFPANSMVSPSAIEAYDYKVSLPNIETPAGEKIQVPIAINDATGLSAGGITVKYDATVLRAVDYASLKLLNGYYWKANTNLPGEVRFAFATTEVVTTVGQGNLLMVEFEVLPNAEGMTSPLILENVNLSNSRSITKINGEVRVIPSNFALLQNFPNPFNPDTWLPYKLASASPVSISIYNAKGQLIRTLHFGYQNAGVYVTKGKAAYWDGRDNVGEKVGSGVYFYTLQTGEFASTRKMVIVK